MAHLWYGWHGNLAKAETYMQIAQSEAEEIGDVVLQSRILTYLTLIYRQGTLQERFIWYTELQENRKEADTQLQNKRHLFPHRP